MENKETLEEAALKYASEKLRRVIIPYKEFNANVAEYVGFVNGAKWQEQKTTDLLQQNTELLEALKELTSMCYKLKIQHFSNKVKICLEAKEELIQKQKTK